MQLQAGWIPRRWSSGLGELERSPGDCVEILSWELATCKLAQGPKGRCWLVPCSYRERERDSSFKSPEAFYRPMLTGQLPAAQGW